MLLALQSPPSSLPCPVFQCDAHVLPPPRAPGLGQCLCGQSYVLPGQEKMMRVRREPVTSCVLEPSQPRWGEASFWHHGGGSGPGGGSTNTQGDGTRLPG